MLDIDFSRMVKCHPFLVELGLVVSRNHDLINLDTLVVRLIHNGKIVDFMYMVCIDLIFFLCSLS